MQRINSKNLVESFSARISADWVRLAIYTGNVITKNRLRGIRTAFVPVIRDERDGGVDNIIHNLHTSPYQFHRYLDIAYMNPDKANQILSGKLNVNVNDLFQISKENQITMLQAYSF